MASKDAPKHPAQPAGSFLQSSATYVQRTRTLAQLDAGLAAVLPEKLRPYISLANIRGDSAVIVAESAVWAARAKALAPRITRYLRTKCGIETLKNVRIVVRPLPLFQWSARRHTKRMSAHSGKALQSLADRVGDDSLGAALRRLARHAKS